MKRWENDGKMMSMAWLARENLHRNHGTIPSHQELSGCLSRIFLKDDVSICNQVRNGQGPCYEKLHSSVQQPRWNQRIQDSSDPAGPVRVAFPVAKGFDSPQQFFIGDTEPDGEQEKGGRSCLGSASHGIL